MCTTLDSAMCLMCTQSHCYNGVKMSIHGTVHKQNFFCCLRIRFSLLQNALVIGIFRSFLIIVLCGDIQAESSQCSMLIVTGGSGDVQVWLLASFGYYLPKLLNQINLEVFSFCFVYFYFYGLPLLDCKHSKVINQRGLINFAWTAKYVEM